MFKKSRILAFLLLPISLMAACSDASNSYVGEWYSVENPNEIHFNLHDDNTVEIFDKNDYYKGKFTIEENRLCISISSMQGGCGYFEIQEDITVIDMGDGDYMVKDLEDVKKLSTKDT